MTRVTLATSMTSRVTKDDSDGMTCGAGMTGGDGNCSPGGPRSAIPIRKGSLLLGGEKRDSEETGHLKTVSFGGAWHSGKDDEETLLTHPKSRRDRRETELGRDWAQILSLVAMVTSLFSSR